MTLLHRQPRSIHPSRPSTRILGLGHATPPHISQQLCADLAEPLCADAPEHRQFLRRVYANSGVQQRGSALLESDNPTIEQIRAHFPLRAHSADRGPTTQKRMQLFAQHAPPLATRSAQAAIASAGLSARDITHLIPVTCTGFFSPGLDVHLINALHLSPQIQRVQIGFMGCHGAFNALATAMKIAQADPHARVLLTCVELCSLHLAYGFDPQRLIANALFADGSASAVVGAPSATTSDAAAGPAMIDASTVLIPETTDAMTWRIGDHGFEMTLAPAVPSLIRAHLAPWLTPFLAQHDLSFAALESLAIHPGGPKILTATAEALGLDPAFLAPSRQVLAEHGNMSSATILFVLDRILGNSPHAPASCLALGFGPGLTAEAILLKS